MTETLDQYQAACLLGISPELIQYFTERTVKKNDNRKLQVAYRRMSTLYFHEQELKDYNNWLFQPWPSEGKQRPHLPGAIKREVKAEAAGECAICHKHGNSCEAAHIAPVATTKCNHPHNLLWLCANHHTKFDNGSLGPKGIDNELVKATKLVLQSARRHIWKHTAEVSAEIAALLKIAKNTTAYLKNTSTQSDAEVAEGIGKKVLALLPKVAAKSNAQNLAPIISKISAALETSIVDGNDFETTTLGKLGLVASFEEEFLHDAGLKNCPLCRGIRWHNEQECPVCQGEGTVITGFNFDPTPYALVTCRLCKGNKRVDGEDCPACAGEGQLEARFDERIDWSSFNKVTCRLCKGNRRVDGEDCPACAGEGQLEARFDEQIDWSSFNKVTCRLCKGNKRVEGEDCPACAGEGQLEARFDEQIDWSDFDTVTCGLCKGDRRWRGEECPVCGGEGKLLRRHLDSFDLSGYRDVNCPLCEGTGEFRFHICPECSGEGKMESWRADCIDISNYLLGD